MELITRFIYHRYSSSKDDLKLNDANVVVFCAPKEKFSTVEVRSFINSIWYYLARISFLTYDVL